MSCILFSITLALSPRSIVSIAMYYYLLFLVSRTSGAFERCVALFHVPSLLNARRASRTMASPMANICANFDQVGQVRVRACSDKAENPFFIAVKNRITLDD